jgi:ribonuclease HII
MIGVDEVGRGSWAGPLVVCAVRLRTPIEGLADSKMLSKKRREELYNKIISSNEYSLGWVSADDIDDIGLIQALKLAAAIALDGLSPTIDEEIVVDGNIQFYPDNANAITIVKADTKIPAVSAASIVAKVIRDNWMESQDSKYPLYGFAKHVGYGTQHHKSAIETYGLTALHRRSFRLPNQQSLLQ